MDNSNSTNCCAPNQESNANADCCTSNDNASNKNAGMKKKIGLGILGLAFVFALTTAFKGTTETKASYITTANFQQ